MAFTAKGVIVRKLELLTICFKDKESIWVMDAKGNWFIFHRWFAPLGSYTGVRAGEPSTVRWKDFRRKMLRTRFKSGGGSPERREPIDINYCFKVANRFGVLSTSTHRTLDLKGRKVIYRE